MTKIDNKFKIYKRYQEDFWGFLYFNRKKKKVTKNIYKSLSSHRNRIDPKYLDIQVAIPFRKKRFFKDAVGKSFNMLNRFLIYFINLNLNKVKLIFKKSKKLKNSYNKNFAFLIGTRIDFILYTINLFFSKNRIKAWIKKKRILLNLKPVYSPSQTIKIGDIISFNRKDKEILWKSFKKRYFKKKFKRKFKRKWNRHDVPYFLPPYLDMNYRLFFFCLWRSPSWGELPFLTNFNISHIFGNNKIR